MKNTPIIDCDVHNDWATAEVLLPYLAPNFRDYMVRGEKPGPRGAFPHAHRPWLHPEDFRRYDITPETNEDHFTLMKMHLLDRYNVAIAILTGEEAIEASTLANPHYASALTRAYNEWMVHEWLPRDPRFKGSLVIAPQDPHGAAAEIRRLGEHPDIVQVLMSHGSTRPYSDPFYHPIWEAAHEVELPVAIHLGGQGGINHSPIGGGPLTYFWSTHALLFQPAMTHVVSTIAQGVFEKWPNTRFILIECGTTWLPSILWRMDADFKALRKETPLLKRLPSEYAHEHIRLTTQPLEQPAKKEHLWNVLEAMDGQHVLMYASDYPHWDFDDPMQINIPPEWREDVFYKNALDVYKRIRLPERTLASRDGDKP